MLTAFLLSVLLVLMAGLLVHAFFLWLSCRLCAVRRPGPPPVGVGYGRAFLVSTGFTLLVCGLLVGCRPLVDLLGLIGTAIIVFVLYIAVLIFWLRWTLPVALSRAVLLGLVWTVFSFGYNAALFFAARSRVAEPFIVPTGAMAPTVLGYHKHVVCPSCGYPFDVNASSELEPSEGAIANHVVGCTCPNCRQRIGFTDGGAPPEAVWHADPGVLQGDRVVVAKGPFGSQVFDPQRFEISVFRHPEHHESAYIERLVGLPGETVAVYGGKLYVLPTEKGLHYNDLVNDKGDPLSAAELEERRTQLWQRRFLHEDDDEARALFKMGQFTPLVRPPDLLLAQRQIVYDNDHPARGPLLPRWLGGGWKDNGDGSFRLEAPSGRLSYRQQLRGRDKLSLITDFSAYNSYVAGKHADRSGGNWVGDLLLECEVVADKAEGELALELGRGVDRFQAVFELAGGVCTLTRNGQRLDSRAVALKPGTSHAVRFANVDQRLVLWIDGDLTFGDGVPYMEPTRRGPRRDDLEPARIIASSPVTVRRLKLWRDAYYTALAGIGQDAPFDPAEPETWDALKDPPLRTFYVQPGHYFYLGDNSAESSDSRLWGVVPRALLLGRAVVVYYPLERAGMLR
jgi:signal peptidase I